MRGRRLGVVCLAGLVLATRAGGETQTVVLTPAKDNTLFSNGNSNGAGDAVFTGFSGNGVQHRALLAFRVAGQVPAGSTVTSASLTLHLIQSSLFGESESHTLHRVGQDWGEGTSFSPGGNGAPPTPGDATWTHTFFPDQFWLIAGGDFEAVPSASQTVGNTLGPHTWGSTPQLVADVQAWLDTPSTAVGWIVIGNEAVPFSAKKFASRENLDADLRPRLTIEFEPPACPWDCSGDDDIVGINDFLALLAQWGTVGGSCDFGLGDQGVDILEFLALLANWGACP